MELMVLYMFNLGMTTNVFDSNSNPAGAVKRQPT